MRAFASLFQQMPGKSTAHISTCWVSAVQSELVSDSGTAKSGMLPCRMQAKQSAVYRSVASSTAEPAPARPGKPFTKRELSRFLGITERFIELEVNRGRLRAVRLSNRLLRFRPRDVEQWMESSLTATGSYEHSIYFRFKWHRPLLVRLLNNRHFRKDRRIVV